MSNEDLTNELVTSVIVKKLREALKVAEYELQHYCDNDGETYDDGFDDGEYSAYAMMKEELERIIDEL